MDASTFPESNLEQALQSFALDLRRFVTKLQRPRLADAAWLRSARRRCQELSERVGTLRERLAEGRQTIPQAISDLRSSLQAYAEKLSGRCSRASLGEMRSTLGRRYEDLLAQVRSCRLWRPEVGQKLRSLRLPSWARSLFHLACGLGGVLLYQLLLPRWLTLTILFVLVGLFAGLEISRRFSPRFNDFMVDRMFGPLARPQERYRVNSASWYLLALTVIVLFTPLQAACAGALALAFGDPTASLVGSRWGRIRLVGDKSLEGSLAFFGASSAAAFGYFLLAAPQLAWLQALAAAASLAALGAVVELFSDKLDDNFTVPVACALLGMLWF